MRRRTGCATSGSSKGAILKLVASWPLLPPLAGNRMLKWINEALQRHGRQGKGSLMPPGLTLNLFVTATDIHGYNRPLPVADPPAVNTVVNKHVFEFYDRQGTGKPRRDTQRSARVRRARDVVLPRGVPGDEARRHHPRRGA